MTAQSLLSDLTAAGVILSANGDRLDIDAPNEVLTDELLTTLRDHKAELLALLQSRSVEDPDAGATSAAEPQAEEFTLTPPDAKPDNRPRLGSCARPRVLLGTRMPADCPYHTCNGTMSQRGYTRGQCTLAYCKICDNWFELKPDTPGVYVGATG